MIFTPEKRRMRPGFILSDTYDPYYLYKHSRIMTEQHIDNWQPKKEHLRKRFPELTEDDLIYQMGKEEELLERLQKKLDKDEDEIRKWLSWMG